jgi:hypothetical protein
MNHARQRSLIEYDKKCPATAYKEPHDWRYASSAPGWYVGDACARCERCQLQGIKPLDRTANRG